MIKRIAFIFFVIFIASSVNAQVANLNEAQTQARSENKLILVKFSGSDWCGPCIMLKKSIYDTQEFISFANEKLILLNVKYILIFNRLRKRLPNYTHARIGWQYCEIQIALRPWSGDLRRCFRRSRAGTESTAVRRGG